MYSDLKSSPPVSLPMGGMITSLTRLVTIDPKAAPTTTATARSMTLPRSRNALNSLINLPPSRSPAGRVPGPLAAEQLENLHRLVHVRFLAGDEIGIEERLGDA